MIKKFTRVMGIISLLTLMYTAVGYASPTDINITIQCRDYLQKGEEFDIVNNGKAIEIFKETIQKHTKPNITTEYGIKTALELDGSNELEIQYIKNDKLISTFVIPRENGKIIGTCYFDGVKFLDEKHS